jgi:hypothetical protein
MTRREILLWMPRDSNDVEGAHRIVALGYPAVEPVLRDIVHHLRVAQSPVAEVFAAFLSTLSRRAAPAVLEGLRKENCWLRHRLFEEVFPNWPREAIEAIQPELAMVATQPDAYDNDIRCIKLLASHGLLDLSWLSGWLDFKKDTLDERSRLLDEARLMVDKRLAQQNPPPL